jgi:hypothetical protein
VEGAVTLRALLDAPGNDTLVLVTPPTDLDRVVSGVRIWDERRPADAYHGALVFLMDARAEANPSLLSILRRCEVAGAVGVVVQGAIDAPWALAMAESSSLALLSLPADRPWDECYDICRTLVGSAGAPPDAVKTVLEAITTLTGCPVLLEDTEFRLIAFSSSHAWSDDLARVQILTGTAPPKMAAWLRRSGIVERADQTEGITPVRIPGVDQRALLPIRGPFGSVARLWITGPGAVHATEHDAALRIHARQLALALAARDATARPPDTTVQHCLRGALSGSRNTETLGALIGWSQNAPIRLLGFKHVLAEVAPTSDLDVLGDLVRVTLSVLHVDCFPLSSSDTLYLLARADQLDAATALRVARESIALFERTFGRELACVVGTPTTDLAGLGLAREEMDRNLRVMVAQGKAGVIGFEELRTTSFFAELREHFIELPVASGGPLTRVLELDASGHSEYIGTLQAYFNANCDIGRAARTLFVHRNTVKYRLDRLQELAGIDLDDPLTRFTCEVQMRLLYDF